MRTPATIARVPRPRKRRTLRYLRAWLAYEVIRRDLDNQNLKVLEIYQAMTGGEIGEAERLWREHWQPALSGGVTQVKVCLNPRKGGKQ